MTTSNFKYELDQAVMLTPSGETGVVVGLRRINSDGPNEYEVRYTPTGGDEIKDWFFDADLALV